MEELQMIFTMLWNQVRTAMSLPVLNLGFTFWDLHIGIFVVGVSLAIINHLFGGVVGSSEEQGGNSKNVIISDDRKDDE